MSVASLCPVKHRICLTTRHGERIVTGLKVGLLAVHSSVNAGLDFTVTHLGTGLAVAYFPSEDKGVEAAKELQRLIDFDVAIRATAATNRTPEWVRSALLNVTDKFDGSWVSSFGPTEADLARGESVRNAYVSGLEGGAQ